MISAGVDIREFDDSLLDGVMELFRRWGEDHPELADDERFQWQKARRWVALFQDKVVGHIAQFPAEVITGDSSVQIGWAATLVVDQSNPMVQTFAGAGLLNKLHKDSERLFTAVGVVPEIEDTHRRSGYRIDKESARMFARFFRPARALAYQNKPSLLSPVLTAGNMLYRAPKRGDGRELEMITEFDPAWDNFWRGFLTDGYEAAASRTAAYLNYKLDQPGKSYICYVHRGQGGTPDGYVIARKAEHPAGKLSLFKICDLVGSGQARRSLLGKAVAESKTADVDGVVSLGSNVDTELFRSAGLWVARPFTVVLPPELQCSMHVSFFDSDLDDLW